MHPALALLGDRSSSCGSHSVQFHLCTVECRAGAEQPALRSPETQQESSPGFCLQPLHVVEEPAPQQSCKDNVSDTVSHSSKRSVGRKKERRTRKSRSSSTTGTNTKVAPRREPTKESATKQLDDIDVQELEEAEEPRHSLLSPQAESAVDIFDRRFEVPTEHNTIDQSPRDQVVIVQHQLNLGEHCNSAERMHGQTVDDLQDDLLAPAIITQTRDDRRRPEAECLSAGLLNIKLCQAPDSIASQGEQEGSAADSGSLYNAKALK